MNEKLIIDATDAPLGRLASYAAKQALLGKNIVILNCESSIISGNKKSVIKEYTKARQRGGSSLKGPHFPKSPERIVKRTIRGMLSYKQGRGSSAFKRIICYNAMPIEYQSVNKLSLQKELKINKITLKELSKKI